MVREQSVNDWAFTGSEGYKDNIVFLLKWGLDLFYVRKDAYDAILKYDNHKLEGDRIIVCYYYTNDEG